MDTGCVQSPTSCIQCMNVTNTETPIIWKYLSAVSSLHIFIMNIMHYALYLPAAVCQWVDLKWCITRVHQHPQSSFGVKVHVQGTAGQGDPAVWHKLLLALLSQCEKLEYGHAENTRGASKSSVGPLCKTLALILKLDLLLQRLGLTWLPDKSQMLTK